LLKWILFLSFISNLLALEISLTSAKENFSSYSTLHLKDNNHFICQEIKNDFDEVTQIVCAFNKKPSSKIKELQNSFFKIENKIKNKTFFLIITPFYKIKLFSMIFNMTTDKTLYQADVKLSNHWMIVGYEDKLPYITKEEKIDTSINFPYESLQSSLPFVGGLDIKGNPVHIKRVGDVSDYLKIKKLYKEKKYDLCLELIDEVMEEYPNSLFNSEFIYYKIRTYSKLEYNDNVLTLSKEYLREYSSDENVPEVLALVARAYSNNGQNTDADYFFDRLFSEHAESEYANWGYIYKGEMLEASGGITKALQFYQKALDETKDIDIGVVAAYKLADFKVFNMKEDEASNYIMKIIKVKPSFFINDLTNSIDMMRQFAELKKYTTAAAIAKSILNKIDKEDDRYEELLKDRALWLSQAPDKQKALLAINEYLKQFKDGTFSEIIEVAKDELFFDTSDANFSVKIDEYNKLIEDYENDSIGDRAIYEKAKLYLQKKMYSDVLSLKESLLNLDEEVYKDTSSIVKDSAIGVMKLALENRKCQEVLNISKDYNITLSNKWDDGIYECSMMGGDYILAKKIANRNLSIKDLKLRKKWLYRYIKVDFATGNYSDVIEASKELKTLITEDKDSKYIDVHRILFDTYQRLEDSDKLLDAMLEIQKIFGADYKDIERYISVMSMGNNKKDDNIVIKYGEEVVKIQKASSSYAQSPFVEFTLYQAYLNKEDFAKALDVIKSLDSVDLDKKIRARQKYLLGSVLSKLWRDGEAQVAYQESIDADPESAWAKLATSAKSI